MTYSFISKELAEKSACETMKMLRVANPLTEEFEYMRDRLIGSMLKIVTENQEEVVEGRAFELSNIYLPRENDLPEEMPRLLITAWSRSDDGREVFAAKGAIEALFAEIGIFGAKFERTEGGGAKLWHPGRSASITIGGEVIGGGGECHPELLGKFGIDRRVAAFSLDFRKLLDFASLAKFYEPIPAFPRVKRDVAFLVDRRIEHAAVAAKLKNAAGLVASADLFDVFEDAKLGQNRKSMAYHLEFGASDRTLTAEEVDLQMNVLRDALTQAFGAEFRG